MKRILSLIAFLLLPTIALAADKTAYIRTACSFSGDGTASSCAGAPAGAGAYNTCALAIVGELVANANLVTMGGHLILDAAGTTADTARCRISGFTTDTTHRVKLHGDLVGGIWSTSYYRLDGTPNGGMIEIEDEYVEIDKMQVKQNETGSGNTWGIYSGQGNGGLYLKVTNSIIRGSAGTGGTPSGIFCRPDVANAVCISVNNIVYGFTDSSARGFLLDGAGYNNGETIIAYNNTCHGSPICFETHGGGTGDAQYIKNNAAQSCSTCYSLDAAAGHTTSVTTTNLSEDTSSPNNALDSKVISFVSETGGSEDLHLASGDTAAKDAGTDLSADAQYSFSTDFEGTTRPQGSAWDVGADELTSSGVTNHAIIILEGIGAL